MRRPMRFAFLAALILCWGVSLVTAQTPVTRPTISEQVSPVEEISIQAQDGYDVIGVVRKPPGRGRFPAVVVIHGGRGPIPLLGLKSILNTPTPTRFLAAGYVTMIPTFRTSAEEPQALWDTLAIVEHVKQMGEVDPNSVVVYGCSSGGALVLEIAGETEVAATTSEEPATVLFTGMFNKDTAKGGAKTILDRIVEDVLPLWEDPHRFYTPAIQRFTQERIRKINGPIFIAQGDQLMEVGDTLADHHKIINEILIPELKAAGKELEEIVYPGQQHCFGLGGGLFGGGRSRQEAASKFFADMHAFFKRHLPTQPQAVDDSLVEHVPIEPLDTVRERVAITVSSEILADYVGTYEMGPGMDLIVTLEDNQLMVKLGGFDVRALFAESETDFFSNEINAQFGFVRGDDGIVTHVIVHMGSNEMTAPRK